MNWLGATDTNAPGQRTMNPTAPEVRIAEAVEARALERGSPNDCRGEGPTWGLRVSSASRKSGQKTAPPNRGAGRRGAAAYLEQTAPLVWRDPFAGPDVKNFRASLRRGLRCVTHSSLLRVAIRLRVNLRHAAVRYRVRPGRPQSILALLSAHTGKVAPSEALGTVGPPRYWRVPRGSSKGGPPSLGCSSIGRAPNKAKS